MLLFALMDATSKVLVRDYPVSEALWIRYFIFTLFTLALAWPHGIRRVARSANPWLQGTRALLSVFESACFVIAFRYLPLADTHAVAASSPLMVVALSAPLLGERIGLHRGLSVLGAFAGVLLIIRPGFGHLSWPLFIPLLGAFLWAIYQIMVRFLARDDRPETTLLWSAAVGLIAISLVAPWEFRFPDALGWALLTAVGVLIIITPWTVRNYRELHVLCPIRDNYWLEFYAGNFGDTSDPNPPSAHPASNPVEMQKFLAMGEPAYLAEKHTLAVAYVSHHPGFFAYVSLRRFVYYWTGFWSFSPQYMDREPFELPLMFFDICVALMMLRGASRFWQRNRSAALPYLVLIGVFPLTYYLSHPLMDYRQPIEPAIIVLAIAGVVPWTITKTRAWIGAERSPIGTK